MHDADATGRAAGDYELAASQSAALHENARHLSAAREVQYSVKAVAQTFFMYSILVHCMGMYEYTVHKESSHSIKASEIERTLDSSEATE